MPIIDAQIHLWRKGEPTVLHQREPFLVEDAIRGMDEAGRATREARRWVLCLMPIRGGASSIKLLDPCSQDAQAVGRPRQQKLERADG